ncbi:MAG: porin family protein [Bacteroidota bacterium]|nr:porin family protein [Bacteroidota bacterium]
MKNILKFSLVVLFLFSIGVTKGQVTWGPKVGLNLASMSFKSSGMSFNPKMIVGFQVGAVADMTINDVWSFQPGLLLNMKGSKYTVMGDSWTIKPLYLEIPLHLMYKIAEQGSTGKYYVFTGPYFSMGVGGKIKDASGSQTIKFGGSSSDDLRRWDGGADFGLGWEYQSFQISVQYQAGISNTIPNASSDEKSRHRVFGLTVVYLLKNK